MYDTVVCSIRWPLEIDESQFQGERITREKNGATMIRMWHNPTGEYLPRVTYWRRDDSRADAVLRIEFSVPKLARLRPSLNPSQIATKYALAEATHYMRSTFNATLPNVAMWRISRVDYAWNWELSNTQEYLAYFRSLQLGPMHRHTYPDGGVVWKGGDSTRWVKFYDKAREAGLKDGGVLRFEVSNYRRAIRYMCRSWFGCEPIVDELLKPERALYCMAVMFDRLGLGAAPRYELDESTLLHQLRRDYGRAAPSALYALKCISAYGTDAYKEYGLLSANSYYGWRKRLQQHNYLSDVNTPSLDALHLPTNEVIKNIQRVSSEAQNLVSVAASPVNPSLKNSWEILRSALGLVAVTPSKYLIGRYFGYAA